MKKIYPVEEQIAAHIFDGGSVKKMRKRQKKAEKYNKKVKPLDPIANFWLWIKSKY